MPTYVTLINLTEQAVRAPKEMPKRVEAAREAVKKGGGKWLSWYATMGVYDVVVTTEFPNDEAYMRWAYAATALGNVRTTTLKAFSEADLNEIVGKLP